MTECISYLEMCINSFDVKCTRSISIISLILRPSHLTSHLKPLTSPIYRCNTTHLWCGITVVMGTAATCSICFGPNFFYSGQTAEAIQIVHRVVDCDGHCSRSTASACTVCIRHNLENLAAIVSRCTYYDLTVID